MLFGRLALVVRVQALLVVIGVQEVQGRLGTVSYLYLVGASALLRVVSGLVHFQHPVLVKLSELKGLFLHVF